MLSALQVSLPKLRKIHSDQYRFEVYLGALFWLLELFQDRETEMYLALFISLDL